MAVSLEQFVQNLVRAGLFTADELATFQQNLPPDRQPKKPQDLARELHKAGRLTKYQAARVFQGKTKGLVLGGYVVQEEIGADAGWHGHLASVPVVARVSTSKTAALMKTKLERTTTNPLV